MKFPPAREDTGNGGRKKEETIMISQVITKIQDELSEVLDENQMKCLSAVLQKHLSHFEKTEKEDTAEKKDMLPVFIAAKRVEGCSEKSLRYYESTIRNMLESINKPECQITTEDLRSYLDTYQRRGTVSKVTLDNVRRILSSFFAWLEDEDYIVKSPVRRIHKVKTGKTVKETYTDESLEMMRDHCDNLRDLAMIDLLASTGIRVGDDDDKIRLNQRKPSKYKGLSRFGPEKNLQRINKFMKERPIFYKNLIQMKENFRFYLRCFYCITKVVILQFNSENRTELARNG